MGTSVISAKMETVEPFYRFHNKPFSLHSVFLAVVKPFSRFTVSLIKEFKTKKLTYRLIGTLIGLNLMDSILTVIGLSLGGVEMNPLGLNLPLKLSANLVYIGLAYSISKYQIPNFIKYFNCIMFAVCVSYIAIVANNITVIMVML
jgi:hypothetical protein